MNPDEPQNPKALDGVKSAAITTAQVVRNPKAFLDWRGWFRGLYSTSVTAFATSITSWLGSNGVEGAFPKVAWLHGIGMDWKTAVGQALIMAVLGAMRYISKTQGLPPGVSQTPFALKSSDPESSEP